ncbi:PF07600 family protein [Leptospira interrogans str. FPW1039]|nr:conserved hypothetical protein [Leptospira interrogans serovar Copenhageni str. Fiocruz L1-130]EKO25419.1 PF07600 family protein [Leptospira interrogans str. UI 12621]EKQ37450.1 PF07600 family protein [Leptospira interrogans str. 2002000621]EKR44507.1 PF07600 family protein [Leptospira interrogans serovar Grippotyphosa str. UI 08368]EMF43088.1 PF07600 family protein [Leptospira interrogans serovar Lora str. TE 1992]EMJ35910.1 PF07600 family protein [Leptospira interrogans str. FPW1039]EMN0
MKFFSLDMIFFISPGTAFKEEIKMLKHHLKKFTEFKGKSKKDSGPSDLLVPIHLENYLHKQIKKHKNLKNYFHYLILKFQKRDLSSKFPDAAFRKTLYQSKNQQLIRYSFRPDYQDWYKAKFIGFYFSLSVCRLFSRLVDLDREEDLQIINLAEELIKLGKQKIHFHFYFKIFSNSKIISKKMLLGKNFELNSA